MISNSYKGWFFHVNKSLDVLLHDISYIKNKMKKKNSCYRIFLPGALEKKEIVLILNLAIPLPKESEK